MSDDETGRIAERYRRFARDEVHGQSEIYERLVLEIAATPDLLRFLATLPRDKRQPQLFLAAVRHLHGLPESGRHLCDIVGYDGAAVRAVILARSTQTNEAARCSVLLPLLARLPQPLAIVEVGASAGLCLIPDRYGYDYGAVRIDPPAGYSDAPVLRCASTGPVPFPAGLPQIVWRRGLDLNPIDVCSDDAVAWLELLVWPGQENRLRTLRAAVATARRDPPKIAKGDLLSDLAPLLAEAPKEATLVVFHTAVLAYVASADDRALFVDTVRQANAVWISNEAPQVFPSGAANAPPAPAPGRFLLMQDGAPVAWAAPHGQSLDWFAAAP